MRSIVLFNRSVCLLYDSLLKCVPNADSVCIDYGALYTWAEAIDSAYVYRTEGMTCGYNASCDLEPPVRGICPKGWHLPSADEFSELYASMNKKYYAMQAKNFSEWENATDSYGFSAIPVGYVHQEKHGYIGTNLGFWTSSGDDRFKRSWLFYPLCPGLDEKPRFAAGLFNLHCRVRD